MLLMFAVGGVDVGWMLGLGALMGAERATRRGARITTPLGAGLIVGAVLDPAGVLPFPTS